MKMLSVDLEAGDLAAKLFRGFSDASRLSILRTLQGGPQTVSEIVNATALSQPNVSNHLGCLRNCGLVKAAQEGRFVIYELADDRVSQLMNLAQELLHDVARGVWKCTRYEARKRRSAMQSRGTARRAVGSARR